MLYLIKRLQPLLKVSEENDMRYLIGVWILPYGDKISTVIQRQ
jgi:hypothetical protein